MSIAKTCCTCCIELRVKTNDVIAVSRDIKNDPLEIYSADLWYCPSCGTESLLGFGNQPNHIGVVECEAQLISNADQENPQPVFDCWLNQRERIEARQEICSKCEINRANPMCPCPRDEAEFGVDLIGCNCCDDCREFCADITWRVKKN